MCGPYIQNHTRRASPEIRALFPSSHDPSAREEMSPGTGTGIECFLCSAVWSNVWALTADISLAKRLCVSAAAWLAQNIAGARCVTISAAQLRAGSSPDFTASGGAGQTWSPGCESRALIIWEPLRTQSSELFWSFPFRFLFKITWADHNQHRMPAPCVDLRHHPHEHSIVLRGFPQSLKGEISGPGWILSSQQVNQEP